MAVQLTWIKDTVRARGWRSRWLYLPLVLLSLIGAVVGVSAWWAGPLADKGERTSLANASVPPSAVTRPKDVPPPWPEGRVDGEPAKRLLLETLIAVGERLDQVDDYTATFQKQERMKDTLGPLQTMEMKVHHHPFAIYFKFLTPKAGKEVVYAEGRHDNKVIAHTSGLAGFLVPRLAVPPDHPLALAESRHPVTEAGLANLTAKLIRFRRLDLDDPDAVTILDRTTGPDGRAWLRSIHEHKRVVTDRPFARVEVLYDPDTRFPLQFSGYDWPKPGQEGELLLGEHYVYENLKLDAALTAIDFDPANPAYSFRRY